MSLGVKGALGFAATGVTATGALYAGGFFKGKAQKIDVPISKLLRDLHPKKRLIESSAQSSDAFGRDAGKAYRAKNKDSAVGQDTGGLKEGTSRPSDTPITDSENAPEAFIQACSSNSEKKVVGIDDDLYKEVLEFCTRDASIKDGVLDSGRSLLETSDEAGGKRTGKLYRTKNAKAQTGSDTGQIANWNPSTTNDNTVLEGFKTKCTDKLAIKSSSDNFDEEYPLVFDWCTK